MTTSTTTQRLQQTEKLLKENTGCLYTRPRSAMDTAELNSVRQRFDVFELVTMQPSMSCDVLAIAFATAAPKCIVQSG